MSEERMKVLELLSEGKVSVEEADRLLRALGEKTEEPQVRSRTRVHRKVAEDIDELEDEIRQRVDQARETIRTSIPHIRQTVQEAIPDIDRIVREATADLPKVINEVTRTITETFADWKDSNDEDRYPEEAERQQELSEALAAGARLVLHNPRGNVAVETWDREEVAVQVNIQARGTKADVVQAFVETVSVGLERQEEALYVRIGVPPRDDFAHVKVWRLNIALKVPQKVDLELRTRHGHMKVPQIDGNVVLGTQHGKTDFEGATGNVSLQQSHGSLRLGPVGKDLVIEGKHGPMQIGEVGGSATLKIAHGPLNGAGVGGNLDIEMSHGPLELGDISGDARIKQRHGAVNLGPIAGALTLEAHHAPVRLQTVGGKAQLINHHAPLSIQRVGGELIAKNAHGPVEVREVAEDATVKNSHGPVMLAQVGGDAAVENSHGPVRLEGVQGRVAVRNGHGPVHIEDVGGEVVAQTQRNNLVVKPGRPVTADYTLQNRHGSVEVELPAGSAVEVQASASNGRIQTDLPLDVVSNNHRGQMASGALGTGEAALKVEVERGNIYLKGV